MTPLVIAGVLLWIAEPAPGPATLVWDAPTPPCLGGAEVEAVVVRLAGRLPAGTEVEVEARVRPEGPLWRLDLRTTVAGTEQARTFLAETCDAAADATALYIAVATDPVVVATNVIPPASAVESVPEPAPVDEPVAAPVDEPVAEPPPDREQARRPSRPLWGLLGIGGGIAWGMVPSISGVPALSLGIMWGRLQAELRGRWVAPRTRTATDGAAVRVQVGTAAAVVCGAPNIGSVRFPLCLGFEAGGMRARGRSVPNASVQVWSHLAPLVSVGLRWQIRPWVSVGADVEAAVPVTRNRAVLDGAPTPRVLYAQESVGIRALLGTQFRLRLDPD